jgi:hypothetical protein
MVDLSRLRVSLTKNGYMKLADVLKEHPRWEVLDNVDGVYPGIKLVRSQAANIMGEDLDGQVPEHWDEIRSCGDSAIDAFVFIAVVMSHAELITVLRNSAQGDMKGYLRRDDLGEKAYTNLVFAMASVDACDHVRGAEAVAYDLRAVVYALRDAGPIVASLLKSKLRRCGWREPLDGPFLDVCQQNNIHQVFGLEFSDFKRWMENRLRIDPPSRRRTAAINTRRQA